MNATSQQCSLTLLVICLVFFLVSCHTPQSDTENAQTAESNDTIEQVTLYTSAEMMLTQAPEGATIDATGKVHINTDVLFPVLFPQLPKERLLQWLRQAKEIRYGFTFPGHPIPPSLEDAVKKAAEIYRDGGRTTNELLSVTVYFIGETTDQTAEDPNFAAYLVIVGNIHDPPAALGYAQFTRTDE